MSVKEKLLDAGFEDVVYFPDFGEECIVGIDTNNRVVYSFKKMVDYLIGQGDSEIDAIEWIEYNTIQSLPYIDNQTNGCAPIIIYDLN